jgi:uncharacterized oligopeptide transporter (OPT) family protein
VAEEAARLFRIGARCFRASTSFSMALIGVGHLVGLGVGLAMLVGMVISWGFLVPYYTAWRSGAHAGRHRQHDLQDEGALHRCGHHRHCGGLDAAARDRPDREGHHRRHGRPAPAQAGRGAALALTEQDLPIGIVGAVIVAAMIPIGLLLANFAKAGRSRRISGRC